jgi:hypothetical protein
MSSAYKPKQRQVAASVYTTAGWFAATFNTPPLQALIDYLNQAKGFLKLTAVRLPSGVDMPFFALLRTSALVVVPAAPVDQVLARMAPGQTAVHNVSCWLDTGSVSGSIEFAANLRVSDYLAQHTDFIALRDCTLSLPGGANIPQPIPIVVVFAGGIIGVTEEGP